MNERESAGPAFFEGFAWALPLAFAGPVSACRFEQGDVFYRDRQSYGRPQRSVEGEAIQVLAPPRSARGLLSDGEGGNRREANWRSPVELELIDLATGAVERRTTTQGRLWSLLWKGAADDVHEMLASTGDDPPFPQDARELHGELEASRAAFDERAGKRGKRPRLGSRFLMVVDLASDASRAKAALVADRLTRTGACERLDLTPTDARIPEADRYSPTLLIRQFRLPDRSVKSIESELRGCLYRGGRDSSELGTDGLEPEIPEAAKGRFSVARHGFLEALP